MENRNEKIEIKRMETEREILGKAYVHWRAWKEAYGGLLTLEFLDGRTLETSQEQAFRAHRNGIKTWVALDGDRVVGFADYGAYRWEDLADAGEVYAIYLLEAYYGAGIGRALMQKAVEAMEKYERIAVWALEGNRRAIRFYEKFGYALDGATMVTTLGREVTERRMVLEGGRNHS